MMRPPKKPWIHLQAATTRMKAGRAILPLTIIDPRLSSCLEAPKIIPNLAQHATAAFQQSLVSCDSFSGPFCASYLPLSSGFQAQLHANHPSQAPSLYNQQPENEVSNRRNLKR